MKIMRYYFNNIEKTKLFPLMKRWKADIFVYFQNVIGTNFGGGSNLGETEHNFESAMHF